MHIEMSDPELNDALLDQLASSPPSADLSTNGMEVTVEECESSGDSAAMVPTSLIGDVAPRRPAPAADAAPRSGFDGLGLNDAVLRSITQSGYSTPTPIQAQSIPVLLTGRDLLGQAQTGSGKTAAFALPLLQQIDTKLAQPQVLVLVPTRELAIQVASAFERYAQCIGGLRAVAIYGGSAYQPQFAMLKRGAHVVVGTPGRVMDHMNRGSLKLESLRTLVLDEADEMLRMGFAESVEWVLTQLPAERQIALFSATLPGPIRQIAQQHLRNPVEITIRQKTTTADTIRQRYVVVGTHQKESALGRILEAEPTDAVLVFVRTRNQTEPLAEFLNRNGFRAAALNGDLAQAQRERIIDHLKTGQLDIVVATDVAARGLDVQRISHVINYDLPGDDEAYVHRIGRTGRAGRSGEAILFLHPKAKRALKNLERATRQTFEAMELPTNRQINKQRVAKFHARIVESTTHPQVEAMGSIIEQFRRENPEMPIDQLLAALAVMVTGGEPLLLREEFRPESFVEDRRRDDRRDDRRERSFGDDRPRRGLDREQRGPVRERGPRRDDSGMETFRIEVGHAHEVKPGNIVGAIANEAGIDSARIGRIEICDDYSLVDLPAGMPDGIFFTLQKVWVSGRQLRISRVDQRPRQPRFERPVRAHHAPRKPGPGRPRAPHRKRMAD